jgi:hypothetical protein
VAFLDRADAVWQDYCAQMLTVRCIFLYLDRTFVIGLPGLRSIFDMGLQLLRAHLDRSPQARRAGGVGAVWGARAAARPPVLVRSRGLCAASAAAAMCDLPCTAPPCRRPRAPQVKARIVRGLLLLVERERHGEAVDRQLVASLVRMLKDLGLYASQFEAPFLEESRAFYKAEAAAKIAECDTAGYLAHCEVRRAAEGRARVGREEGRAAGGGPFPACCLARRGPSLGRREPSPSPAPLARPRPRAPRRGCSRSTSAASTTSTRRRGGRWCPRRSSSWSRRTCRRC